MNPAVVVSGNLANIHPPPHQLVNPNVPTLAEVESSIAYSHKVKKLRMNTGNAIVTQQDVVNVVEFENKTINDHMQGANANLGSIKEY